MLLRNFLAPSVALLALAACGDGSHTNNTPSNQSSGPDANAPLNGTLQGNRFAVQDAIYTLVSDPKGAYVALVATDAPQACALVSNASSAVSASLIVMALAKLDATATVGPGTYPIIDPNATTVPAAATSAGGFSSLSFNPAGGQQTGATSGSLVLTAGDPVAKTTLQVQVSARDANSVVAGTVQAAYCDALAAAVAGTQTQALRR